MIKRAELIFMSACFGFVDVLEKEGALFLLDLAGVGVGEEALIEDFVDRVWGGRDWQIGLGAS
jgi:hypothetical protein